MVSYQLPIHDIAATVERGPMGGVGRLQILQLPVFPAELGVPDYRDERYDPLFSAIPETGVPICCHIGMNTPLDGLARRDPTPQRGSSSRSRSRPPRRSACG